MSKPEFIDQLFKIALVGDYSERIKLINDWIDTHIVHIENTQLTLSSKKMNLENHDFICEKIAHDCIDSLIESNLIQFGVEDHSYTAEMWAIKHNKSTKKV